MKTKKFRCKKCAYASQKKWNLKRHMANRHNINVKWYKCDQCSYQSKQKDDLGKHVHRRHSRQTKKNEIVRKRKEEVERLLIRLTQERKKRRVVDELGFYQLEYGGARFLFNRNEISNAKTCTPNCYSSEFQDVPYHMEDIRVYVSDLENRA